MRGERTSENIRRGIGEKSKKEIRDVRECMDNKKKKRKGEREEGSHT